jgi:hypothetical protein
LVKSGEGLFSLILVRVIMGITLIGIAEILGGGAAPPDGFLAQTYSIDYALYVALDVLLLRILIRVGNGLPNEKKYGPWT